MPYGKEAQKKLHYKNRTIIREYLGGHCVCCLSTENLQFDHIDPETKGFTLGDNMKNKSVSRLKMEAYKCQLLCQDCHRYRHKIAGRGVKVMSPDDLFA